MKHIDEARLETDLNYRFRYICEFVGLGAEDVKVIHEAASALAPIVAELVDAVYQKLHTYDATWRHFLPRQHGYDGEVPMTLEQVTPEHPIIRYRKEHLARYLVTLVTKPYDAKMTSYLDMVGKIHTSKAGSAEIHVPLVQMNALLGFVADALNATIHKLGLPGDREIRTIRAFNKLLWIQNDLINRHYQDTSDRLAKRNGPARVTAPNPPLI